MTEQVIWDGQDNSSQETSRQNYRQHRETGKLTEQQRKTLEGLKTFVNKYGFHPTCQELGHFLSETTDWYIKGVTQMQPRLTSELPDKGLVVKTGEKTCPITGRETSKWKPVEEVQSGE